MKKAILVALLGLLSAGAFAQSAAPMMSPADNPAPIVHRNHRYHQKHRHHHAVTAQGDEAAKP